VARGIEALSSSRRSITPPQTWSRVVSRNGLQSESGQRLGRIASEQVKLCPRYPLAIELSQKSYRGGGTRIVLVLRNLNDASALESIPLLHEKLDSGQRSSPTVLFEVAGARACVVVNTRVYPTLIGPKLGAKAPQPFRFEARQSQLVIGRAETATLTHTLVGGKKPLAFELLSPLAGLEIDTASGKLTVSGTALHRWALAQITERVLRANREDNDEVDPELITATLRRRVGAYSPIGRKRYAALTGARPAGVPVSLAVHVFARDKNGEQARLNYLLLLDISEKEIVAAGAATLIKAAASKRRRMRPRPEQKAPAEDSGEMRRRMKQLEARMRRLEKLLDLLLKEKKDK